jgi:hypothetical protein
MVGEGEINNEAVLIVIVPADINGVMVLKIKETDSPGNNFTLSANSRFVLAENPATEAAGKN